MGTVSECVASRVLGVKKDPSTDGTVGEEEGDWLRELCCCRPSSALVLLTSVCLLNIAVQQHTVVGQDQERILAEVLEMI